MLNVTVLEYTAFIVFGMLYAGLWFVAAFVTAYPYPAGAVANATPLSSALYPNVVHPVIAVGTGKLTAVTVWLFVFNNCVAVFVSLLSDFPE